MNALNAVRRASNYVSRELEESKRITSTAESLKESSQDELERAERILSDAEALVRREARRLLDEPWTAGRTPSRETVVPSRRRTRDTKPRRTTGKPHLPEDRPVVSAQQQKPSEAVPKEPSSISSEPLTQPSNAVSPGDLESALNEFLRSVEGGGPEHSMEEELVEVPREQSEDLSSGELDSLKKELESFKSQEADAVTQPEVQEENLSETIGDLQQPPTETEKEFRDQLLEKLGDTLGGSQPDQNLAPEVSATPNLEAAEKTLTLEPMGGEQTSSGQPSLVEASYKGTLYIVVAPPPDQAALTFFWDVIDSVAGVGKLTAHSPLADGSGDEFTLDMGDEPLVTEALRLGLRYAGRSALSRTKMNPVTGPSEMAYIG